MTDFSFGEYALYGPFQKSMIKYCLYVMHEYILFLDITGHDKCMKCG